MFRSEGIRVLRAPYRAPRARVHAERRVGTVRRERLDWVLVVGERHLERLLYDYVEHYNASRPHRALDLHPPAPDGRRRRRSERSSAAIAWTA